MRNLLWDFNFAPCLNCGGCCLSSSAPFSSSSCLLLSSPGFRRSWPSLWMVGRNSRARQECLPSYCLPFWVPSEAGTWPQERPYVKLLASILPGQFVLVLRDSPWAPFKPMTWVCWSVFSSSVSASSSFSPSPPGCKHCYCSNATPSQALGGFPFSPT